MLLLLQLEWKKLIANRTFKVMSIIYLIALPAVFFMWKGLTLQLEGGGSEGFQGEALTAFMEDPYIFPNVWKSLGYLGSWLNFYLLGIIGILIITNEYDFKTLRQSIINGLTRKEYYTGKILMVIVIGLVCSLYFLLLGFITGFLNTDYIKVDKVLQNIHIVPLYTLQIIGYMSLAALFGWIFKRFALALIFYCIYPALEAIFINGFIAWVVKTEWVTYLPISVLKNLVPMYFPSPIINGGIAQMAESYEKMNGIPYFVPESAAIILSILFSVGFIWLGYRRFKMSNL